MAAPLLWALLAQDTGTIGVAAGGLAFLVGGTIWLFRNLKEDRGSAHDVLELAVSSMEKRIAALEQDVEQATKIGEEREKRCLKRLDDAYARIRELERR